MRDSISARYVIYARFSALLTGEPSRRGLAAQGHPVNLGESVTYRVTKHARVCVRRALLLKGILAARAGARCRGRNATRKRSVAGLTLVVLEWKKAVGWQWPPPLFLSLRDDIFIPGPFARARFVRRPL